MSSKLAKVSTSDGKKIPFANPDSQQMLEDFGNAVGGVNVIYINGGNRHYLGLDTELKEDGVLVSIGKKWASSPDEALTEIMKQIGSNCVDGGLPLILDAYGSTSAGRREFFVMGDCESGFVYRLNESQSGHQINPDIKLIAG